MPLYTIKAIVTYSIECESDSEALDIYHHGLYDQTDEVYNEPIELGINKDDGYHIIKE